MNTTKKKQKKRKKPRLLSLLFASEDVCLGGANFVDERAGLIKKKIQNVSRRVCLFFFTLETNILRAVVVCERK